MYRGFERNHPLKCAFSILVLTAFVFIPDQTCLAKKNSQPKKVIISEKPSLDLIEKLGHQPELLTPEYLQYVLGRPSKRNIADGSNTVLHWQTNSGGIGTQDCELSQTRDANQNVIRASFKINLPRSTVTLADVEKKIDEDRGDFATKAAASANQNGTLPPAGATPGNSSTTANGSPTGIGMNNQSSMPGYASPTPVALTGRKLFDQQCRPSLQYSFVPYTKVFYTQAANTFHVHFAQIDYAGPPLPPPSQADMAEVATAMRTRAIAHQTGDKHNLAVPMLHDHLADNPGDAEAHYSLGVSYQKASHLNEAISEYQLALRYSNGNTAVANNAVQSLQALHVLPSPDDQLEFHTLRFSQHGQGLTEGDVIATQNRQALLANQTPFYTTNAPPINSSYNSAMPGLGFNGASNSFAPTSFSPPSTFNGSASPIAASAPSYAAMLGSTNTSMSQSGNSGLVGLKAPPAGSLNAPTSNSRSKSPSLGALNFKQPDVQPENVRYTPMDPANQSPGPGQPMPGQPSFYDSMQYGTNLFPAAAPNPNLEPGF